MRKRVKRLNLNTTKRSHDKLLIKNLFTSLIVYGVVTTTVKRAKSLKSYAQSLAADYAKQSDSRSLKRWANENISSMKFRKRAMDKLAALKDAFKVSIVKVAPRKGDNAVQYEVSILNFDQKKTDEQNNVAQG
ncbi:MAG: L17 family ribosomal protein [Candidatus Dojkabacteria bacterium]|nr:MAG: L17 family ribosomal protein [Candidatus Dojkabacteria bacterium]